MILTVRIDAPDTPFVEYNGKPSDLRAVINTVSKFTNVRVYTEDDGERLVMIITGDNK